MTSLLLCANAGWPAPALGTDVGAAFATMHPPLSGDLDGRPRLTRCTRARRCFQIGRINPVLFGTSRFSSVLVELIRRSLRAASIRGRAAGSFPSSVGDRNHSADRRRPPRRLGKSDRVHTPCSGSRAFPVLDLAAGPVRGVIYERPGRSMHDESSRPSQTRRPRTLGGRDHLHVILPETAMNLARPRRRPEGRHRFFHAGPPRMRYRRCEHDCQLRSRTRLTTVLRSGPPVRSRCDRAWRATVFDAGRKPTWYRPTSRCPAGAACVAPPLQSDAYLTWFSKSAVVRSTGVGQTALTQVLEHAFSRWQGFIQKWINRCRGCGKPPQSGG
jgi:hypothetical protein